MGINKHNVNEILQSFSCVFYDENKVRKIARTLRDIAYDLDESLQDDDFKYRGLQKLKEARDLFLNGTLKDEDA